MIWKYCEDCHINGHCENQDRGHECNVYAKRITDKAERLQKQLDRAKDALRKYTSKIALTYNDGTCYALRPYNDNGREAQKALDDIEELNK